ncbi:MAG TPA: glucose-6-phosphate isomerase [Dokdonella sp.]|uniref:glucose-6-phosphate isomerase n=1 Tax=Dokdonella sp. TaxID=2291710 RepID=UPI002BB430E1|nr:glucose-6-phosphate isomerase [Dokdonella sp.]HUD43082.1 glucose-6-phosphate isomerase [Dokdonella sp.]
MTPDQLARLRGEAARVRLRPLRDRLAEPGRFEAWSHRLGPLLVDFSRQWIDDAALDALGAMLAELDWEGRRDAMFRGEPINTSERRAVLHTALRAHRAQLPALAPPAVLEAAAHARHGLARLVDAVLDGSGDCGVPVGIEDVVNVGIGGSDLGPRLAVEALANRGRVRSHFLANLDGTSVRRLMRTLDPRRTLVLLVSKSFTTQETHLNGEALRAWMLEAHAGDAGAASRHFVAVTANVEAACAQGIAPERIVPMWDFVGGRYSVWSGVGLALALAIGHRAFDDFLGGAALVDDHFRNAPWRRNLPVLMALAGVWNRNALGFPGLAVIPYCDALANLPAFLQQLEMESLGKSVRPDGAPVDQPTVPVLWGHVGTNAQHAFFQALHQGTDTVPVDFVGVATADHGLPDHHAALLANMLAQAAALAGGKSYEEAWAESAGETDAAARAVLAAQRTFPGSRPSTTILLDSLTPTALGALLALYEHKVFVQSLLWNVNAFDQWGVELGKTVAKAILPALRADGADETALDPPTRALVAAIRAARGSRSDTRSP